MRGLGNSRMFWPLALPLAIVLAAGIVRLDQPGPDQLQQVRERGALVLLTRGGPSTYFQGPEGETGPEYDLARAFANHLGVALEVRLADGFDELEGLLSDGDGDFVAANLSPTPDLERRMRFSSAYAVTLDDRQEQAWGFRPGNDDSLAQAAEVFLQQARDNGQLASIQQRYQEDTTQTVDQLAVHHFMEDVRERLPQYLPVFREVAEQYDMDWRLLAALAYQESQWDPQAVSATGVTGLMQITRRTATAMGLEDRDDPAQSIDGGARYLARMHERMPRRIVEPDRTWMALAAYNIGWGHLEDARVLTQNQGGNPDSWMDVHSRLPLLTQERYFSELKHGYARGYEAQRHVRSVRGYFELLVWMELSEHPLLVAAL